MATCLDIENDREQKIEKKLGYNFISSLVKRKFSPCIVMQIRYCTALSSSKEGQPPTIGEHIAT
jgi:hypothetical protein